MTGLLTLILLAPGALGALTPDAAPDALSLDAAVDQGLARHPQLAVSAAQIQAAEAAVRQTRANYGAKVKVQGNAFLWHDEQTLALGEAGGGDAAALPPPTTPYEFATAALIDNLSSLSGVTAREQFTTSFTVQVVQPLVDLWKVSAAVDAQDAEVGAQRVQRHATERAIAKGVIEVYLRVLQAGAAEAAAQASLTQIGAELARVQALFDGGLLDKSDVLRLQVAQADAQRRVSAAAGQRRNAQLALGLAMGTGGAPAAQTPLPPWMDAAAPDRAQAVEQALRDRVELAVLGHRAQQAEAGVAVARAEYLPSLALIGQYQRQTGSELQPPEALFGGLALEWTVFEWGATGAKIDQAQAQQRVLESHRTLLQQQIALETEQAWQTLDTATQVVGVAEQALTHAEEAYRLEQARHAEQKATTTDLLAAETALTNARLNLTNARFDRLVALNALRHATGQPLRGAR
ncbi:MAG: TolC family protein [Myxococcales bacterium]|nr:TolC family protein [Myxococcales bacterium]